MFGVRFFFITFLFCMVLMHGFTEVAGQNNPFRNKSIREVIRAAENGNPDAQVMLGDFYAFGFGVEQDALRAAEWIKKAAENGNLNAGYWLADSFLMDGEYEKAFQWFLMCSLKGHSASQYSLAELFRKGKGTEQNFKEAKVWYQKSAESGYALSQFELAKFFLDGIGTKKDHKKALYWFQMSLHSTMAFYRKESEYWIGYLYDKGEDIFHDKDEALKWYKKSADKGEAAAQYELALIALEKDGNYLEAYKWLLLSRDRGDERAKGKLSEIRSNMSTDDMRQAQTMAYSFKEKLPDVNEYATSAGTGFFITSSGFLLTAKHVIYNAKRFEVKSQTGTFPAVLVESDAYNDIALLKVEGDFEFSHICLEDSGATVLGESVYTVGFPNVNIQGFHPKYTEGEVSSLTGIKDTPWNFQVSVPVQPGNSGGPLVNRKGNVIGILISILAQQRTWILTGSIPQNVAYAVKSKEVLAFLKTVPGIQNNVSMLQSSESQKNPLTKTEEAIVLVIAHRGERN